MVVYLFHPTSLLGGSDDEKPMKGNHLSVAPNALRLLEGRYEVLSYYTISICQRTPGSIRFFFFVPHLPQRNRPWPQSPDFKGKVPISRRPSVLLDHWLAPLDGGFYYASEDTLFGGVPRAADFIYFFLPSSGRGGTHRRKSTEMLEYVGSRSLDAVAGGAPLDGGLYCAFADTLFDGISCSFLSICSFFTP